ncbi:MAG: NAD-dependent epimerase/dehydratase family protein [Acidimicrobiales bacterium]
MGDRLRVLITGAGGYLGSRLAARLAENPDVSVVAYSRSPARYLEELTGIAVASGALDVAAEGCDTVVHLAGAKESLAATDPGRAISETVQAATAVAALRGPRRVVYLSTVHVYGRAMRPGATVDEETLPEPQMAYAIARLASEHVLEALSPADEIVLFRLSNTVGPPLAPLVDRWSLVANDLCRQVATNATMTLATPGHQWRDFVALDDVLRILDGTIAPGSLPAGTYNLASGHPVQVRALAEMIFHAAVDLGEPPPRLVAPDMPAERPPPFYVSTAKLASYGWAAATPVEHEVRATLEMCLRHRHELGAPIA